MSSIDFSTFEKGVFMINAVGIVYDKKNKKILIGKREKDEFIPEISWGFPGGRPSFDKEIEEALRQEVLKKTNINVKVKKLIFARITPELEKKQIILYYYCEGSGEIKPGEKFVEVKWINPEEYRLYFTTSIHPKIAEFLDKLK